MLDYTTPHFVAQHRPVPAYSTLWPGGVVYEKGFGAHLADTLAAYSNEHRRTTRRAKTLQNSQLRTLANTGEHLPVVDQILFATVFGHLDSLVSMGFGSRRSPCGHLSRLGKQAI